MKNYRVFLNDGSHEDLEGVTSIELDGKTKDLIFWLEGHGTNYVYALADVYAWSVRE